MTTTSPSTRSALDARTFRSRSAWGADESLRFHPDGTEIFPQAYFAVQTITVHHTATPNTDLDWAARVRSIYTDHAVHQGFGDIGYHLLIDPDGMTYEGRFSGADGIAVFGPRHDEPNPLMCNAAHVGGFNAGNVGVALLGDFTTVPPSPAAFRALVRVLGFLGDESDLDPVGTIRYENPISGARRSVPTISGHRDSNATACPGDALYPQLPAVRQRVAGRRAEQRP